MLDPFGSQISERPREDLSRAPCRTRPKGSGVYRYPSVSWRPRLSVLAQDTMPDVGSLPTPAIVLLNSGAISGRRCLCVDGRGLGREGRRPAILLQRAGIQDCRDVGETLKGGGSVAVYLSGFVLGFSTRIRLIRFGSPEPSRGPRFVRTYERSRGRSLGLGMLIIFRWPVPRSWTAAYHDVCHHGTTRTWGQGQASKTTLGLEARPPWDRKPH